MLSSMFNPQEFFLPEELLSPKEQGHNQSFSSTSALPQEFEMGESFRKTSLERHEEKIDEILNHLDELSLSTFLALIRGSGYEVKVYIGNLQLVSIASVNTSSTEISVEISVVKQKHDELVKKSLLNRSQFEGQLKEKSKDFAPMGRDSDLEQESRSKLDKVNEKPYNYTYQNSLMNFKTTSKAYLDQLERAKENKEDKVEKKRVIHTTRNFEVPVRFLFLFIPISHVRFGNDQFAPILGYGDLIQGNVTIKRVYYVEGLNHNLFSVGQFCDADLEVAFRKSTCFVRDLQGNDLLTGSRGSDLYTISLQETTSSTPICFMAKASPTQAWLWHRRLSHLNFDYITLLSKKDVVTGLPKLKYVKDQLCSSCEMSKAKRSSFKTKAVPSSKGRLNLLHMDLCGPMRVASINGKKYILVIVDDYSRYTWTLFLRSKDETPEVLKDFLTMIQRNLQAQVITVRTDRGTEFLNKTLHAYFKEEGIEHLQLSLSTL
ncbi:retrovirus-related pol polyprotein from transposon TNT 1-94 [Tanacetum coccineum]